MNTRFIYSMILYLDRSGRFPGGSLQATAQAGGIRCHPRMDTDGFPVMAGLLLWGKFYNLCNNET